MIKNSLHLVSEFFQYYSSSLPLELSEDKYLFVFDYRLTTGCMGAVFRYESFSYLSLPTSWILVIENTWSGKILYQIKPLFHVSVFN